MIGVDFFPNFSEHSEMVSLPRNVGVLKLLLESKRGRTRFFFSNCSEHYEMIYLPRNVGVLKLLVQSKRFPTRIFFKLLRTLRDGFFT